MLIRQAELLIRLPSLFFFSLKTFRSPAPDQRAGEEKENENWIDFPLT